MPTKQEYEELFNKIFGTDIRWSKLSKDELAQLAAVLANPDSLIKRLEEYSKKDPFVKMVEAATELVKKREGPLKKLFRTFLYSAIASEEG